MPHYDDLQAANNINKSGLRYLSDYSGSEIYTLLTDNHNSYFKISFVRDPYMRLLSSYMDKLRNNDANFTSREYRTFAAAAFSWPYARSIANVNSVPRPSFRSFVRAVASALVQQQTMAMLQGEPLSAAAMAMINGQMNAHWKPQTELCGFGVFPYDFIGRMENVVEDVDTVMRAIGHPHEHFPTQADPVSHHRELPLL